MLRFLAVAFLSVAFVTPAAAHFLLNLNVRLFHVEHRSDGVDLYVRLPMPYLVADRVGPDGPDGLPEAAPFTTNALEDDQLVHYVDPEALRRDPLGLGEFGLGGIRLAQEQPLKGSVAAVRVHPIDAAPPFATLDEAKESFAASSSERTEPLYVGDAVVDLRLVYDTGAPVRAYTISSDLDPDLPGQEDTANVVLDYAPGGVRVFRARGLLHDPVSISRSRFAAFRTFTWEGVRHIAEGLDHVVFVVCLVLGAHGLRGLLARVTGFTVGHSVTLSAGFFGWVPAGEWFVPTVEIGIAISIVYAAGVALSERARNSPDAWGPFSVTTGIGLLHGLGFSFVLQNILEVRSPDLWQSLLAFNLGVEIGQVAIVLVAWAALGVAARYAPRRAPVIRQTASGLCAAVGLYWVVERVIGFVA